MLWWLMMGYLAVTLTTMICLLLMVARHVLNLRKANPRDVTIAEQQHRDARSMTPNG